MPAEIKKPSGDGDVVLRHLLRLSILVWAIMMNGLSFVLYYVFKTFNCTRIFYSSKYGTMAPETKKISHGQEAG